MQDHCPIAGDDKHLAQLLDLQDRLLESNQLYMADEVIAEIQAALPADVQLFFYLRERRRFTDATASHEPFLRFPFLSFDLKDGAITRFVRPDALAAHEAEVTAQGYVFDNGNGAATFWMPHAALTPEVLAAVRRVFQIFYQVCGSREHFVESVSRRYIREFVRDHGREVADYSRFLGQIESDLGLKVAIGLQRDQFIHRSPRALNEIVDIVPGSSPVLERLAQEPRFLNDLNLSLSKKTSNFGRIGDPAVYYCVTTLIDEHLLPLPQSADLDFKIARRAVLIFMSQGERLLLSALNNATRLIDNTLRDRRTASREDPFFEVLQECRRCEESLGAAPCLVREDLDAVIARLLEPFLRKIIDPTSLADHIAVRRYDPGADSLHLLVETGLGASRTTTTSVSMQNHRSAPVQAFTLDQPLWQYHERYFIERQHDPADRPDIGNSIGAQSDAFHARAIRVGSVPSATIEFTSTRVGNLKSEVQYFERVAHMCGEVIRRIELANDRAWLSRMSYVHAMRHRIESVMRQLEEHAKEPAQELRQLLNTYSVKEAISAVAATPARDRAAALTARLSEGLSEAAQKVCDDILAACETHRASDRSVALAGEILETLLSNRSHAPVDLAQVKVEVLAGEEGPSTLKLTYMPKSGRMPIEKLAQVCVSPIRDSRSSTYHFGLFLLAAQLRMVGGSAQAASAVDDQLGSTHFGATFLVPLGSPDDEG